MASSAVSTPSGDQFCARLAGEPDESGGDRPVRGLRVDAADDADVELDDVGRELEDVPQAREARTRVIHRDPDAGSAKHVQRSAEARVVARRCMFRELDHDALGRPSLQHSASSGEAAAGSTFTLT